MPLRVGRSFSSALLLFIALGFASVSSVAQEIPDVAVLTSIEIGSVDREVGAIRTVRTNVKNVRKGLSGKKIGKAENFLNDADVMLGDLKAVRRQFQKLLRKVGKRQLLGKPRLEKDYAKYQRLTSRADRVKIKAGKLQSRMQLFANDNAPKPAARFGGEWNTNFGSITIAQFDNNTISGTYFYSGGGTIRGKVKGQVMRGTYRDDNGTGSFRVVMNSSGSNWTGRFKASNGNASGTWSASRAR